MSDEGVKWYESKTFIIGAATVLIGGVVISYALSTKKVKVLKKKNTKSHNSSSSSSSNGGGINNKKKNENELEEVMEDYNLSEEEKETVIKILNRLKSDDITTIEKGLKKLEEIVQNNTMMKIIYIGGGLPSLLTILSDNISLNERAKKSLMKSLSILCLLSETKAMITLDNLHDIIYLLQKSSTESKIVKYCLKSLMNLSVDSTFEDKIRKVDGIDPVVDVIINSEQIFAKDNLLALRVIVNLIYNEENKKITIQRGFVDKVIQYFESNPPDDFIPRIIRIVGRFAKHECDLSTYKQIVNSEVSKNMALYLKEYWPKRNIEIVEATCIAAARITTMTDRDPKFYKHVNVFLQKYMLESGVELVDILMNIIEETEPKATLLLNALYVLDGLADHELVRNLVVEKIRNYPDGLETLHGITTRQGKKTMKSKEVARRIIETVEKGSEESPADGLDEEM